VRDFALGDHPPDGRRYTNMPKRKTKDREIHVRLDSDLQRAIEAFRANQECPPTTPEAVRYLLRKALQRSPRGLELERR
jgi:hypothetical protein